MWSRLPIFGCLLLIILSPFVAALQLPQNPLSEVNADGNSPTGATAAESDPTSGALPALPTYLSRGPEYRGLKDEPLYRFVQRLAENRDQGPVGMAQAYWELFYNLGYNVPPPLTADAINESATLSFTFPVGDIDQDGYDDVAFDTYCVAWDECLQPRGLDLTTWICSLPHWLEIRSGKTGEPLWKKDLDDPWIVPLLSCAFEIVIGTTPNDDGTDNILVYRMVFFLTYTHHDIYLLEGKGDGQGQPKVKWHHEEDGVCAFAFAWVPFVAFAVNVDCVNAVLWPHLSTVPTQGIRWVPNGTKPTLWAREVGFIATVVWDAVNDIDVYDYKPLEWASRLSLQSGDAEWRKQTFFPDTERSVFPLSFPGDYFSGPGCCWDVTGDGLSDLLYATIEWPPVWTVHVTGPDFWSSHTIAFDLATGDQRYSVETVTDDKHDIFWTWLVALGDVNGDGVSDFFQENIFLNLDGFHISEIKVVGTVRKGQDGSKLWEMSGDHFLDPLVLGDVNGDKGNDFLLAFYDVGRSVTGVCGAGFLDGFMNVTDVRLEVYNGADGKSLWTKQTFAAPYDLQWMFVNSRSNGVVDLTGDNVGEVWLDAPAQQADLTNVHHQTFLSGATGDPLFTTSSVGAFAFPIGAKDLDGDGGNDFTITQGDIVDLWITTYNGHDTKPLWSRRLMEIPVSSVTLAIPLLRYHSLELDGNLSTKDPLFSFSMFVLSLGGGGCMFAFYQQHQAVQGPIGPLKWAVPGIFEEDPDISLHKCAPTPATLQYVGGTFGCEAPAIIKENPFGVPKAVLVGSSMVLTGGGTLALAFLAVRRRWRA